MRITPEIANTMNNEIMATEPDRWKDKIGELSERYLVSESRVRSLPYQTRQKIKPRKKREDAGQAKVMHDEIGWKMAKFVHNRVHDLSDIDKPGNLPEYALKYAIVQGWIDPDDAPAVETFRAWLRKHKISRRQVANINKNRAKRRIEAEFPNQQWQFDTTVSQQFYIKNDGKFEPRFSHKNKKPSKKKRLILYLMVDAFSRYYMARFYAEETPQNTLDFLLRCFRPSHNTRLDPCYGLPAEILTDKGPGMHSAFFKRNLELLGVELSLHRTKYAWAKAKVERGFQIFQAFERFMTGMGKECQWQTVEHANTDLDLFLLYINRKVCSSTGQKRIERWLKITPDQLRCPPDDELVRILHYVEDERKLYNDMTIRIDGHFYQLPNRRPYVDLDKKQKVKLLRKPGDYSRIAVLIDDKPHDILEGVRQPDKINEFRKNAKTTSERNLERVLELEADLGTPDTRVFVPRISDVELYDAPVGTEFDNDSLRAAPHAHHIGQTYDELDVQEMLADAGLIRRVAPTAKELEILRSYFDDIDEVDEKIVEEILNEYRARV